ncbi:DUF4168 domain-containing protein [Brevundimonas halotolerans]|uniref:Outer membrane murein-binding lipoprotein Lpp n=1 Tax=Brevundimonas halotolerans TaxID=69670 RepID=A0A7W9A3P4_9CAUL|nr:DUF4168 domain-containing protein [Brevundimonas halotolerans]MBB5660628.1 outer membrane murein-binding lipoprotein Lpp [Brevundimonas halotolerans]
MRITLFAAVSAVALMAGSVQAAPANLSPAAAVAQDPGYSDDELKKFGTAMEQLSGISAQIQGGTPTAEQQAEMAGIVENSGLTIDRFNAISQAVSADPVLQARMAVVMTPPSPEGSVAASVTDQEVEQFSSAVGRIQDIAAGIQGGTPTAEQQSEMAAVVEGSGLTIDRFNAISTAVSQDQALQARMLLADANRAAGMSGGQ